MACKEGVERGSGKLISIWRFYSNEKIIITVKDSYGQDGGDYSFNEVHMSCPRVSTSPFTLLHPVKS